MLLQKNKLLTIIPSEEGEERCRIVIIFLNMLFPGNSQRSILHILLVLNIVIMLGCRNNEAGNSEEVNHFVGKPEQWLRTKWFVQKGNPLYYYFNYSPY